MVLISRITLQSGEIFFEALRRNGVYYLRWPRAAEASVGKQGRLLRFDQKPTARPVSIQILRRIVKAYASSLQGKDALHATALETNGRAMAFIGPSGEGKSTLAAYLLKNHPAIRLLSDDLLYTEKINGKVRVVPSGNVPRFKLSREALLRFGLDKRPGYKSQYDPNLEKEILQFPYQTHPRRHLPLVAIVQLYREGPGLSLKKIKGAKAALTLMANIYNEILRPPRVLKNQFELCVALSRLVPVWKLRYPSGFNALPKVTQRLEQLWTP